MKQSSTWRELRCVSFALKSFAHLSRCSVKWLTDNQAVPLIVNSGSMNGICINLQLVSSSTSSSSSLSGRNFFHICLLNRNFRFTTADSATSSKSMPSSSIER